MIDVSASFEYLCYGRTAIIYFLILSVRGSITGSGVSVHNFQVLVIWHDYETEK